MTPYYDDGTCVIYHGDCLDVLDGLVPGLPPISIFVLDPPYSTTPNSVRGKDDRAAGSSGAPVRLLCETLQVARKVLSDGGIAPVVCDWRRMPDVAYLGTLAGLRASTCVAWTRSRPGTGGLFRSAWDPVLVFSAGTPEAVDRAAIPNVVHADYPAKRLHPYEKPVDLWWHIFQRVPSGTVIDPFAGGGSSGIAARRAGHTWTGIECDERYCEVAAKRLAQEVLAL